MNTTIILDERRKKWGILAATALAAGLGGLLLGRSFDDSPQTTAASEAGGEEEAEGGEGEEGHSEGEPLAMDDARIRAAGIELVPAAQGQVAEEFIAQGTMASSAGGQEIGRAHV